MMNGDGTVCGYFEDRVLGQSAIRALLDHGFKTVLVSEANYDITSGLGVGDFIRTMISPIRSALKPQRQRLYADHERSVRGFATLLRGTGMSNVDARHFAERLRGGGVLVTVRAFELENVARTLLAGRGADLGSLPPSISEVAAQPDPPEVIWPVSDPSLRDVTPVTEASRLQLHHEQVEIEKERIDQGTVTVRKVIVREMQTFEVPVTREELVIERRAAGSDDDAAPVSEEIRLPLSREEVHINKRTVVSENVVVGKRVVEERETFSQTVEHEELVAEATPEETERTTT